MARSKARKRVADNRASMTTAQTALAMADNRGLQQTAQQATKEAKAERQRAEALKTRMDSYSKQVSELVSVRSRVTSDVAVMAGAQTFNEALNAIVRWAGEWSLEDSGKSGFIYRNVDFMQSIPGFLGSAYYVIDSILQSGAEERNKGYVPGPMRASFNKAAFVLSNLGLNNFVRALRYRYAESVDERLEKEETIEAQRDALTRARAELDEMRKQVAESKRQLEAAKKGGP